MVQLEQHASMSRDKDDFDNQYTKVEMVEFGLVEYKAFEGYLYTVDIVAMWDFASSQLKVGQVVVVLVAYHIDFDPFEFEQWLAQTVVIVSYLEQAGCRWHALDTKGIGVC